MPALMQLGQHLHIGAGLGEAPLRTPWQQHYDLASRRGRGELSELLAAIGIDTTLHAPTVVLPSNVSQRILHERYPRLYAGQYSTRPDARSDKNLHVALLKMLHGYDWRERMQPGLFEPLLADFVARQLRERPDFGYRAAYELPAREMRAIIWRLRERDELAPVRGRIPPDWDEAWIDYVHDYVDPGIDAALLDIITRHAPSVGQARPGEPVRHVVA